MSEARGKGIGAFLGLIILFSSYLILTTINPQLSILYVPPVKPVTGVYLMDGGKKYYISDSTKKLPDYVHPSNQIEFISSPSGLIEVYIFNEEDFGGNIKRVKDTATGTPFAIPVPVRGNIKSIYFLWNKPGVYLYDEENFCVNATGEYICNRPPLYLSSSADSLGDDWNKKAESIIIRHQSDKLCTGAVLFTEPGATGKCGDISVCWNAPPWPPALDMYTNTPITKVSDLNSATADGTYFSSIGNDQLSSVYIYTVDTKKTYPGEVTFYDESNCAEGANKVLAEPTTGALMDNFNRYSHPSGTFDKRVVSFLINGEYRVILKTRVLPPLAVPAQADLKCQAFDKADLDDRSCMINLKGSAVYDPDEENERPSSFLIIPSE